MVVAVEGNWLIENVQIGTGTMPPAAGRHGHRPGQVTLKQPQCRNSSPPRSASSHETSSWPPTSDHRRALERHGRRNRAQPHPPWFMAVGVPFAVLISGQLAASDATLVLSITSAGRTTASAKPPVEVVDLSRGGIALLMP